MMFRARYSLLALIPLTFLAACGTIEVGIVYPTPPGPEYQPIPLGATANTEPDFASPPVGDMVFDGVPFQLAERIFKSQASPAPDDGYPTSILLPTEVPHAQKLHLLINTGNGFAQFDGQAIGQVIVTCDDTETLVADLRLGQDIREWQLAHNVIYTASRARQVWVGARADQPHLTGHIDLLSLDLPEACRNGRLTALEITDTSVETVDSLDPALNLFGATIEYRH
jgi:hypothetical protein